MSSAERNSPQNVTQTLCRVLVPAICLFMICVTGVAVVLGGRVFLNALGEGHLSVIAREYAWVVFWTGLAEGLCLMTGVWLFRRLSHRLTQPVAELAAAADRQTAAGDTDAFRTDGPVVELNRLAASFNRLFAAQRARTKELEELTTNILHDLRTPLTQVRGEAESVYRGETDAVDAAARMIESCRALIGLIDTNAEIARTNSGVLTAPAQAVDLTDVIRTTVDLFAPAAEEKSVALGARTDEGPVVFSGHPDKLQRLVGNLVDNALKFTPAGGSVRLDLSAGPDAVRLRVSDTGVGMTEEEQSRAFTRFYRADASRHAPGFGLGLSLVQAIVTFYGGRIEIDSAPGRGTTFDITLPRANVS